MKRLSSFSIFLFGVATVLTPAFVFAQDDSYGLNATAKAADLAKYGNDVPTLIGNVIGTALSLISVIFFVLMIYGGLRWMLSRGNEDQSKKALDTIIAAIIGIIIVLASYAITTFVFNSIGTASAGGGGTKQEEQKKADGATCTAGTQCTSGVCTSGKCVASTEAPAKKADGVACQSAGECASDVCTAGSCGASGGEPVPSTLCLTYDNTCVPEDSANCLGFVSDSAGCQAEQTSTHWCLTSNDDCVWGTGEGCNGNPNLTYANCQGAKLQCSLDAECGANEICDSSDRSCKPGKCQVKIDEFIYCGSDLFSIVEDCDADPRCVSARNGSEYVCLPEASASCAELTSRSGCEAAVSVGCKWVVN